MTYKRIEKKWINYTICDKSPAQLKRARTSINRDIDKILSDEKAPSSSVLLVQKMNSTKDVIDAILDRHERDKKKMKELEKQLFK